MSEEKKHNGRLTFWEHGSMGAKDYDDNVVISSSLGFTEISELRGETCIVKKNGKCWLADAEGNLLTAIGYDRIIYIGEDYYKAGLLVRPSDEIVVEYADVSHVYELLDGKGNILVGREKSFNYLSEVFDGELTAAKNGRCGVIDLHGNVRMDFRYKYIQPMGEGLYLPSIEGEDNYWTTIIDKDGHVMIPASKQYRNIYPFHNGVARANQDGKWGIIDRQGKHVGEFSYSYVEEWGEGYFKVEQGSKKNIMRPDGSIVLKEWYNDVFKVCKGFFIFGNTLRKSKTNPKTRYIQGVAHVNGDIIFPMLFERVKWFEDKNAIYGEIGTTPYILTLDGGIYDPARSHLPQKATIDFKDFFEKFANWTLPGLQFFYRDTNAPVIVGTTYHVGDILRAGFFVDVTTKLQKPVHKTRFLIASAHTAMLCEIDEIVKQNPDVKKWNLCTLHFNSYFKVMDVYERNGVTQVFLLHIPAAAAYFIGHDETAMNFVNEATGQETTLIDLARKSLDNKMQMEVHPRSLDADWCVRMEHPIGLDDEFYPVPLAPMEEPIEGEVAHLSSLIHMLSEDADLDGFIKEEDNFPYHGVKDSVCEGCIYANGIQGHGEGCGRLFIKSFRERYLKGRCEYRKTDIVQPSEFERRDQREKKLAKEAVEKQCDKYAVDLLRKFVNQRLDDDIRKLKDFDFDSLRDDREFGDERDITVWGLESMLIKAVVTLAFADTWSGFTYESMDKHKYKADPINITNTIFGIHFEDYYKALETYHVPDELKERVIRFGKKIHTVGNIMVLPFGLRQMRDTKPMGRGYMDVFLREFHKMMSGEKKCNMKMLDAVGLKKKEIVGFRTEQNFKNIVYGLMLDDFLDGSGKPKQVFQGLFSWEPGITRETYLKAATEFLDFCEPFVDKRADRIIEKLDNILKNNQ